MAKQSHACSCGLLGNGAFIAGNAMVKLIKKVRIIKCDINNGVEREMHLQKCLTFGIHINVRNVFLSNLLKRMCE